MDHLRKIQFYLDGNVITPRDFDYNVKKKVVTYNIEVETNYLDKHDGRFYFTADFDMDVVCDVRLGEKKISVVSVPPTNTILFDGFSDSFTGERQTKSIFLKSLEQVKEMTDDPNQIESAEKQNPDIHIDVIKCQQNHLVSPNFNERRRMVGGGNNAGDFYPISEPVRVSKPVFVETQQINSDWWEIVDLKRKGKIMAMKIIFTIVEKAGHKTFNVL